MANQAGRRLCGSGWVSALLALGLVCGPSWADEEVQAPAVAQELDGQGQQELEAFFDTLEDALGLLDALVYEDESKADALVSRWGEIVSASWEAQKEAMEAAIEAVKRRRNSTVKPRMPDAYNAFWSELARIHRKLEWDVRNMMEAKQRIQLKTREVEKWIEQNKEIEKVWFKALEELAEGLEEGEWLAEHGSRKEIEAYLPTLATCINIARGAARVAKESNKTFQKAYKRHQLTDAENTLPDKLLGWELDPQCFLPYRLRVGEWHSHLEKVVDSYVMRVEEWWKGVVWLVDSKILDRFSNMKGWKLEELETKVQDLNLRLGARLRR